MEILTTSMFWNCQCPSNSVHSKDQPRCERCGADAQDQPDSRITDVLQLFSEPPWHVNPDLDQYGFYHLSEAAEEQEDWVNEGFEISDDEGERRQEMANLHDSHNARLIQAAPAFLQACLEALELIEAGKTFEASEELVGAISMLEGIGT
jgi:hypothetical protein